MLNLSARSHQLAVLCLVMVFAVAALDIQSPLGVAAGALYSPVIAASLLVNIPRFTKAITALSLVLIILGSFMSPESIVPLWIAVLNRTIYFSIALIIALQVLNRLRDAQHIQAQQQMLVAANRDLARQALTDGLTGVANRRAFDERLSEECARSQRTNQPLSLLMIDVDHFKLYNDAAGHHAGDDALKRVAEAIRQALRRPVDLVARYGGEEFAVILSATNVEGAGDRAEEIRRAVQALDITHPGLMPNATLTVSIGVGTQVTTAMPESLIQLADEALYRAKFAGRNRVVK